MLALLSLLRHRGWKFALNSVFPELRHIVNRKVLPFLVLTRISRRWPQIYHFFLPDLPRTTQAPYCAWLYRHYPRAEDLSRYNEEASALAYRPLISIIMPAYNTPAAYLRQAIESALAQTYSRLELCIVDDASSSAEVWRILEHYAAQDKRVRIARHKTNQGIAAASNSALALSTGEFVAQLDHDDALTPHALYRVVEALNKDANIDFIYSDEDKIHDDQSLADPFFKPDWSPDTFLSHMYTCHLGVYRRSVIEEVGRFRSEFDGAEDYDLVLRVTEHARKILHIPDVLYHWRSHPGSAAGGPDGAKVPSLCQAARKALSAALARRNEPGTVTDVPGLVGSYHVRYNLCDVPAVHIVVESSEDPEELKRCLSALQHNAAGPDFSCTVVHRFTEAELRLVKSDTQLNGKICWKKESKPGDLRIKNGIVSGCNEPFLLFISGKLEVVSPEFLSALLEQGARRHIGACGALLVDYDDRIRHAGVIFRPYSGPANSHCGAPLGAAGYYGHLKTITNYSAVSGDLLLCARDKLLNAGAFSTELDEPYASTDLCLKLRRAGYYNVFLPHVTAKYQKPLQRSSCNANSAFMETWRGVMEDDPFYSPHLTRKHEDYRMRIYD